MTKTEVLKALRQLDQRFDDSGPYDKMLEGTEGHYRELLQAHANGHFRARHDLGRYVTAMIYRIEEEGIDA